MAEKKSWRDYLGTQNGSANNESKTTKSWRDYDKPSESKNPDNSGKTYSWKDFYNQPQNSFQNVKDHSEIFDRIRNWQNSYNRFIGGYQQRYSGRKGTYEDKYVSDSGDWYGIVSKWKTESDKEADSIIDYIEKNKDQFDRDWAKDLVYGIQSAQRSTQQIYDTAKADRSYWSQFERPDTVRKFGSPEEAYKYQERAAGYYKNHGGKTIDELKELLGSIPAGEEKDWVDSHIKSLEYQKLLNEDTDQLEQDLEKLKALYDRSSTIDHWYNEKYKLGNPSSTAPAERAAKTAIDLTIYKTFHEKYGGDREAIRKEADQKDAYLKTIYNARVEEKEKQQYDEQLAPYMALMENPDFARNSEYKSTYRGGEVKQNINTTMGPAGFIYVDTGFKDTEYDYINRNDLARERAGYNDLFTGKTLAGNDKSYLQEMTDNEIAIYNYLYKTQSKEAANEFLGIITSELAYRRRQREQAEAARYATEHPFEASAGTILLSPLKLITAIGQISDYIDDGKIDQNAGYNKYSYIPSTVVGTVASNIAKPENGAWGKVGSWTYQLGMSMGDFIMNTAVSGGNPVISSTLMGSGAMADTVIAAKDRGLTDGQAFTLGLIAGASEIITEKISLDTLLSGDLSKGALQYILKNAFVEGTEEVSSSVINLFADVIISRDKNEWEMQIQEYIKNNPDATREDAFRSVLEKTALDLGLDFLGGYLMGGFMSSGNASINYMTEAAPNLGKNVEAVEKYGKDVPEMINAGLSSDPKSRGYDLANFYQSKIDSGKELSGYEIRQLKEAVETDAAIEVQRKLKEAHTQFVAETKKEAVEVAKARLTELGETGDIDAIADAVAKKAMSERLTSKERKLLVNSFGSQVAKEIAPGENESTYKAVGDRIGNEGQFGVSEFGKAVVRDGGKEVDLSKAEVTKVGNGEITFKLEDGSEVYAGDIDFASDDQSYLVSAVSSIENITPAAATAMLHDIVDASKPLGKQLNGIDEAFTYGYNGYSEADLKAGSFTSGITKKQMMSAYKLGQSARNTNTEDADAPKVRMRTALQAKLTATERAAKQRRKFESGDVGVYFMDGKNITKVGESGGYKGTGQDVERRMAAVNYAKLLSKLGIGNNYYFFESYKNANGDRVYKDADGNEVPAPNGFYHEGTGDIYIDLNAGNEGQGVALFTLGHEITHFIKEWSKKKFNVLADFLIAEYGNTDLTMRERVLAKQAELEGIRKNQDDYKPVKYEEAFEEVVADAMSAMLADGNLHEKLAELRTKDKGLVDKIIEFFNRMIAKFQALYKDLDPEQRDARDVRAMKDSFDRIQQAFAEALVEASDNFRASMESVVESDSEAKKNAKAVDTLANETVAAQPKDAGVKNSDRVSNKKLAGEQYPSQETDLDTESNSAYDNAKKEAEQEVKLYGQDGKAEDHASFIRRMHEGSRRVKQIGKTVFAYEPARAIDTSGAVSDAARELRRLGIKYFYHNGLEYNHNGVTYVDNGAICTIEQQVVGIYAKAFGDGMEFAGHEAFHVWKKSAEWEAYVETLRRNISITSSVYGLEQADTVLREYFGGDVEALSSDEFKAQFLEELYALVSGKIHSGTNEAGLQTMFKDYAAVKAAWDDLLKKQATQKGQKFSDRGAAKKYIRYSDRDSDGNHLSKEQQEYFKDSKVRGKDGNLLVMYHGSPASFTVFDRKKAKTSGYYGNGFYFTNSNSHAGQYGSQYEVYLNITNPLQDGTRNITKDQLRKFVKMLAENEDYGIDNYGYNATVESVVDKVYGKSDFAMLQDINATCVGNMVQAIELFNEVNSTDYNGIITPTETVAFYSNQIKSTSNKKPTSDQDIRYSERGGGISNRTLLANAFEGLSRNSDEYAMIQEYRNRIRLLEEQEEKLDKINAEIREIRFTSGKYDAKKLAELEAKKKEISKAITRHDKKLLEMEVSAPFRKVIEQERKKEAQKTKAHIAEIQQNKQLRAEQAELRHKVRKVIRDLDKILKRGNKEQNVKEDMKGFVSKALELADYLFTDHISNDDLVMRGIDADLMRGYEAELVRETEEIIQRIQDNYGTITEEEYKRLTARKKRNMEALRELLTKQRNRRLNTPVYNLFDDLVTEYAKLKNSDQDAVKAAYNPEVERFLRSYMGDTMDGADSDKKTLLQNMRVADMTTQELEHLYYAYTMILHSVRDANKLFVQGKAESVQKMAEQISVDFSQRKIPEKKMAIVARNIANKIGWDYEKLYYALDRIGSEAFTELVMNVANSENIVMQDVIEAAIFRDEMVEKYGFNNWDVSKKIDREFLDNTGKKFKLTLGQLMALYAYSRRKGALDHIEYGGFVFGDEELTNPNPADSYKLTREQCEALTDLLTKEQKGYVEAMQKFLSETMGGKGNEVSMMLYGIKMFTEKNYFPIKVAGQFKPQAQEAQAKAAAGFSSMTNAGFTHEQNPNAKAPFVLEGFNEVWADHVNEMSRYHGTVPALEDMRRVMNRSSYSEAGTESMSIKQLMENAFGKEAVDYFDALYREANSGAVRDKLQAKSNKLLSLFRKNSVAYSLSVLIQQPASMVRAYAMIDRKYFGFKGIGALPSGIAKAVTSKWNKAYANAYNEMLKYAPGVTMAKEIGGFDTHTGSSIRGYLLDTKKSFGQKVKTDKHGKVIGGIKAAYEFVDDNAIANLPNVADKIAWIEIWNACKRETIAKHKDLVPTSDEFLKIVGDRFTEVIRATQVYDSMFSKSPMLKSKNLAVQYLVSFMNEPNTVANMAEKAVRDATRGNWNGGFKTAGVVIHSIIFTNLLKSIISAMRDDDEDETYIEKYIEALTKGVVSDFLPFNYIPLVRDAWSKLQGFDVERPDVAIIADAAEALLAIYENNTKDTENMTEKQLEEFDNKVIEANWKLAESVAAFFGIPVKNIRREINSFMDHARIAAENAGKTTWSSALDKVRDGVIDSIPFMQSDRTKGDKLYEAMITGDKAYLERIKSTYKTDDAYESAVRKALRENDNRIKEAAQAHINGDPSERVRIAKLIIADGFNQDDVVMAINAEINDMTSDDSSSGAKKAKGYYTMDDFVREIANGDHAAAEEAKNDVIATAQKNGKTAEEAEKDFVSNVKSATKKEYVDGSLSDATAKKILSEYTDMDEEEVASRVSYWAFCKDNPKYKDILSESNVADYHEFAEPAKISVEVFAKYVEGTKDLSTKYDAWGDVEVSKREQVLEVIDSLPISRRQKDALYLAAGYSESKIWDVPW